MHPLEETQKTSQKGLLFKNVWQHYLHSFTDSSLLRLFILDVFFWGVLLAALRWFSLYIQNKATALGFISPEQFQDMILSAPDQAAALAASLQSVLVQVLLGALLIVIGALLLYSLTRAYSWNFLLRQKLHRKNYWKWNGLVLVFLLIILLYLIPVLVIKFLLANFIGPAVTEGAWEVVNTVVNTFLVLVLLSFFFIVKYSFAQKYRIFESLGQAFHIVKVRWGILWKYFLLVLITAAMLTLVSIPLQKWLLIQQTALLIISAVVFLLLLAWMRVYMVRVLQLHQP